MIGFQQMIRTRVANLERQLDEAVDGGDHYLVDVHLGELESLVRLAADHGVPVDEAQQILARHGHTAPALHMTGPIDLTDLAVG